MDDLSAGRSKTTRNHGRDRSEGIAVSDLTDDRWAEEHHGTGALDASALGIEADGTYDDDLMPTRASTLLTIAVLCLLVLCGATAAISAIIACSSQHPNEPSPRDVEVAGAATFRPDLLHDARWPFAREAGTRGTPSGRHDPGEPAPEGPKTPPHGGIRTPEQTAAEFYSLLSTAPESAVSMLSPEVVGDQRHEIVRSWREVASARTAWVRPGPDGSVLAEVAVEYPDGSRITSRHQLVTDAERIVGARLRTAHLGGSG